MEVPYGVDVIPIANQLLKNFKVGIVAIDWHPANHGSFAGNHPWRHIGQTLNFHGLAQELFPIHCVQNTFGALLHPQLEKEEITKIIHKGIEAELDGFSCFFDADNRRDTGLHALLKEKKVENVLIMGLGIEGDVKNSVMDALELGYKTFLIEDGCKAWDKKKGEGKKAVELMKKSGAIIISSKRILEL